MLVLGDTCYYIEVGVVDVCLAVGQLEELVISLVEKFFPEMNTKTMEMMIERSRCDVSKTLSAVQNKIIIVPNSKIFNLENIVLEEKENG